MHRKCFISFEGIDGAGKTTQVELLYRKLMDVGFPVVAVREPGSTPLSEKIRELLLDVRNQDISSSAESFLYAAARSQLVAEIIKPALDAGKIVIADRYVDSTIAYQGYGRGMDIEFLKRLNLLATGGLMPCLTILLDLPPEEGIARRGELPLDRLEREGIGFHRAVREGYLTLSRSEPDRIVVVDARLQVEDVHEQILKRVLERLRCSDCIVSTDVEKEKSEDGEG